MELLLVILLLLLVLSPAAASSYQCDWCPRHSTASLFPLTDATAYGGDVTMELPPDGFHLAAATADFFRDDDGAACYQLRCRDQMLCANEQGVKVVVVVMEKTTTDGSSPAGFLLSRDAFTAMTTSSSDQHLAGLSHNNLLQVDFRRYTLIHFLFVH
jgi:hypothetical protein